MREIDLAKKRYILVPLRAVLYVPLCPGPRDIRLLAQPRPDGSPDAASHTPYRHHVIRDLEASASPDRVHPTMQGNDLQFGNETWPARASLQETPQMNDARFAISPHQSASYRSLGTVPSVHAQSRISLVDRRTNLEIQSTETVSGAGAQYSLMGVTDLPPDSSRNGP